MIVGTQNLRTCALMFIVLVYLMFGAAVFNARMFKTIFL